VEHLRGDFSFAIWDSHANTYFVRVISFGIKPFYYASVGSVVIFSKHTRLYPPASGRLGAIE